MDALVWQGPERIELLSVPRPEPAPGEVVIRVAAVGICGSELEGYLGLMSNRTPPLVMGHEFSGTVAEGDGDWVGKRVAVNPVIACGECVMCRAGTPNLCPSRTIIGIGRPGAFAEFVAVPQSSLVELGDGVTDEAGALVEPLAVVVHALDLDPGQDMLVIGAGSIGLLATQLALVEGAERVVVTDLSEGRLAQATRVGATRTVAGPDAADEQLRQAFPTGADLVVDCVGAAPTKQLALRHVRSGGTVILLGLHEDSTPLSSHELVRREITLRGSFTYTPRDVDRALELLRDDRIRFEAWTQSRPLSEGPAAFRELVHEPGDQPKIFLRP